ncbi:hypothetical protein [Saccharopolyspora gloriosae]|uniref:hypothetical protein n=1 Tax=Saccharopolyspora gloriosae TaxID=455344 RepID=UPI001FB6F108|nr:hypothetical protein [Saccharopolyspora gloriosae]
MQIPGPDTRVVELRVHGILGTTGDALTDSVASVDVAGDGVGRIVRPADRLRRPVPGPMLTAGDRTVPRIVEGYVWGGMTSGGWAKATWALMFPFALSNVAHWMLPPHKPGSAVGAALSQALRALLRVSALLLTMLFVAQLAVVLLDLLAAQCLRPGAQCLTYVPESLRATAAVRAVPAMLLLGLIVLLMHRLSSVSWKVSGAWKSLGTRGDNSRHSARAAVLPGANVVADPDTPALRSLHVVGALSVISVLALGGPLTPSADPRWLLAELLLLISIGGTLLLDDPSGMASGPVAAVVRGLLSRTARRVVVTVAAVLVFAVAIVPGPLNAPLPGSGSTVDAITVGLLLTCVAVAVLLVPAALLARPGWSSVPRDLRPWAGGWMAAPVLMLACMLGAGFGAGLGLSLREALGVPDLMLPAAYDDVALFWGSAAVLLAVGGAGLGCWMLIRRWLPSGTEDVPAQVALLHAGRQQDQRNAAGSWRTADVQRRYSHHLLLLVAAVLTASTLLALGLRAWDFPRTEWADWLRTLGVLTLGLLAAGLLRMVQLAAKERTAGRYLGILCDLTLFWPREAHPVVPPCYALKVVPELAARAAEHLAEPDTRVVLVGHSQGSLLAAVATARLLESLPEADRERVGLVTAGSQLQWAYPRAFPGVVPHKSLRDLAGSLNGRWRSLCRGTDALGGAVTTWNRQVFDGMLIGVGLRPDGSHGPLPPATRGPTGALVLGGDHWLPDPQRGPFSFRRWVPGVLGHSDYSGDPEWDRAVAMAAGLEIPVRGATLPLRTPAATAVAQASDPLGVLSESRRAGDAERGGTDPAGGALSPDDSSRDDSTSEDATVTDLLGWDPDEVAESDEAAESAAENAAEQDPPSRSALPEITDPRGRAAPWERGNALRAAER